MIAAAEQETDTVDGLAAMVVVYDPNTGFVTGHGWIDSPAGAYVADRSLAGRANFGFVSRYQKGATIPTGSNRIQISDRRFEFSQRVVRLAGRCGIKGAIQRIRHDQRRRRLWIHDHWQSMAISTVMARIDFGSRFGTSNNGGAIVYDNQLTAPDGADPTTTLRAGNVVVEK